MVSDVIVGENLEEEGTLARVPRSRAKLRYVAKGVVLGGVPDCVLPPDDLEKEIKVGFKKLDYTKAVYFWGAGIFFKPDLEGSAPTCWRAAELDREGKD